jgi:hypothetical protein
VLSLLNCHVPVYCGIFVSTTSIWEVIVDRSELVAIEVFQDATDYMCLYCDLRIKWQWLSRF